MPPLIERRWEEKPMSLLRNAGRVTGKAGGEEKLL